MAEARSVKKRLFVAAVVVAFSCRSVAVTIPPVGRRRRRVGRWSGSGRSGRPEYADMAPILKVINEVWKKR